MLIGVRVLVQGVGLEAGVLSQAQRRVHLLEAHYQSQKVKAHYAHEVEA